MYNVKKKDFEAITFIKMAREAYLFGVLAHPALDSMSFWHGNLLSFAHIYS